MKMTLGSLFDGIGGWLLAAKHAGIEPLWSSEIEPFPCAVTKHHFPDVVQLGDITKLDGAELWPVDIICAGSPCQDLSVAGKQEGLKGARSGLFRTAIRLVRDMRRASGGRFPRFFVWENVPGAFSSNRGMDFQAVLEEIGESAVPMPEGNRWASAGLVQFPGVEVAWRVLDAQYWGVPQRRRRIFLVADFRGHCAGEILFERESVHGDSSESGEAGEGFAAGTESGVGGASVLRMRAGCAGGGKGALVSRERSLTLAANTNDQVLFVPDKARSLTARNDGSPCVDRGPDVVATFQNTGRGWWNKSPIAQTLRTPCGGDSTKANLVAAGFKAGAGADARGLGYQVEQMPTLTSAESGTQRPTVAVYDMTHADEVMRPVEGGKCQTLNANNVVRLQKSVRRLTPTECERLQGLPDGYTLIDDKTCSDTARYKALGNGMAQPCADYVIKRIFEVTA